MKATLIVVFRGKTVFTEIVTPEFSTIGDLFVFLDQEIWPRVTNIERIEFQ